MENRELLPCPWCGEKPDVLKSGLVGHACFVLDREIRADIDAWNRRVPTKHITELVALLWQAHNELLAAALRSDGIETWQAYEAVQEQMAALGLIADDDENQEGGTSE